MIVSRSEILLMISKQTSATAVESAFVDMVHPLVECAVQDFLQVEVENKVQVEILPAEPLSVDRDILISDYERTGSGVVAASAGGLAALHLRHTPAFKDATLEVREDYDAPQTDPASAFGSDDVLTYGDDYWLDITREETISGTTHYFSDTGTIHRYGSWPNTPRTVKVTYTAGWSNDQLNNGFAGAVKLATLETIALLFKGNEARNNPSASPKSESIGKYSYSAGGQAGVENAAAGNVNLPPTAMARLQPYRSYKLF